MNAHPKDRSERRTIDAKKRRENFVKKTLKKQELEDERREKAHREHLAGSPPTGYHPVPEWIGEAINPPQDIRTT